MAASQAAVQRGDQVTAGRDHDRLRGKCRGWQRCLPSRGPGIGGGRASRRLIREASATAEDAETADRSGPHTVSSHQADILGRTLRLDGRDPKRGAPPREMTAGAILLWWRAIWRANGRLMKSRLSRGSRQQRWKLSKSAREQPPRERGQGGKPQCNRSTSGTLAKCRALIPCELIGEENRIERHRLG